MLGRRACLWQPYQLAKNSAENEPPLRFLVLLQTAFWQGLATKYAQSWVRIQSHEIRSSLAAQRPREDTGRRQAAAHRGLFPHRGEKW